MYINDLREAYADRYDLKRIGTACARGMKQLTPGLAPGLTPGLTHGILQNSGLRHLTKPRVLLTRQYATQLFLECIKGGSDDAQLLFANDKGLDKSFGMFLQ